LYHSKDFISGEQTKFTIDYGKFPKVVAEEVAKALGMPAIDVVRVHLVGSYPSNCDQEDEVFAQRQRDFLTMLKSRYRYELRIFPVDFKGRRLRKDDRDVMDHFEPKEKCVDIALASSLLYHAALPSSYDVAIVVIGDKDFLPVLEDVRRLGKRVVVVSVRGCCSCELFESDDNLPVVRDAPVIWLDDIADRMELKIETFLMECESPIHKGDLEVETTYHPKDGEPFYCDECRHAYAEMLKSDGPKFDVEVGMELTGLIKTVIDTRGYGFIVGEDGRDYFFHATNLVDTDFEDLRIGQKVDFEVREIGRGERSGKADEVQISMDIE